jgi:hypothetical protein
MIEDFKVKARKWAANVVALKNTPATGALAIKKTALLKRASFIKRGVDGIFSTLKAVGLGEQDNSLGLLPLIPVAIVGASLAAMGKWFLDYKELMVKLAEQQRLESKGLSPAEAARVVAQNTSSGGIFSDIKKVLPLIAIGGAALFFYSRF